MRQPAQNINKANPSSQYHKSCNCIVNSNYLSAKAFLLHSYLASKPADWVIRKEDIARFMGCSTRTALLYMAELKKFGHLSHYQETDDYGQFCGSYYQFHELPVESANESIVIRIDEKRKRQKAKESRQRQLQERERVLKELAEEEAREGTVENLSLHKLFKECLKRLKKVEPNINQSDTEYLKLSFKAYARTHKGRIYEHGAYAWMENALKFRMKSGSRTMKIGAAKDIRSDAVAANQQAQADYINAQTRELRSHTPKTSEQKINDTSWSDGIDFCESQHDEQKMNEFEDFDDKTPW